VGKGPPFGKGVNGHRSHLVCLRSKSSIGGGGDKDRNAKEGGAWHDWGLDGSYETYTKRGPRKREQKKNGEEVKMIYVR